MKSILSQTDDGNYVEPTLQPVVDEPIEEELPTSVAPAPVSDIGRAYEVIDKASLPSEYLDPSSVFGKEKWNEMVQDDVIGGGQNALDEFRSMWDWGDLSLQQKAKMVMDAEFDNSMGSLLEGISISAIKQPVDPTEFAKTIIDDRLERSRR